MAAFDVDVAHRYLKLAIVPQSATVTPGGSQRVTFALTRKNGAAVPGEIVAMVVNDAILQLTGYRLPDLVTTVFAQQPISTMISPTIARTSMLKTQTAPARKRLWLRRRLSRGRGQHPRAPELPADGVLRRAENRRVGESAARRLRCPTI